MALADDIKFYRETLEPLIASDDPRLAAIYLENLGIYTGGRCPKGDYGRCNIPLIIQDCKSMVDGRAYHCRSHVKNPICIRFNTAFNKRRMDPKLY